MYKRRSLLFLPASQPQYYDKIDRGEVCPDAIIFDLEDSIPAAHKQTARQELARLNQEVLMTLMDLELTVAVQA